MTLRMTAELRLKKNAEAGSTTMPSGSGWVVRTDLILSSRCDGERELLREVTDLIKRFPIKGTEYSGLVL